MTFVSVNQKMLTATKSDRGKMKREIEKSLAEVVNTYAEDGIVEILSNLSLVQGCGEKKGGCGHAVTSYGGAATFNGHSVTSSGTAITFNGVAVTFNRAAATFSGFPVTFNGRTATLNGNAVTYNKRNSVLSKFIIYN